jgi:hypothetical protein
MRRRVLTLTRIAAIIDRSAMPEVDRKITAFLGRYLLPAARSASSLQD